MQESQFIYDAETGLYYDYVSGQYYDAVSVTQACEVVSFEMKCVLKLSL